MSDVIIGYEEGLQGDLQWYVSAFWVMMGSTAKLKKKKKSNIGVISKSMYNVRLSVD